MPDAGLYLDKMAQINDMHGLSHREVSQLLAYARSLEAYKGLYDSTLTAQLMAEHDNRKITAERDAALKRAEEAERDTKHALERLDDAKATEHKLDAARAEVERLTGYVGYQKTCQEQQAFISKLFDILEGRETDIDPEESSRGHLTAKKLVDQLAESRKEVERLDSTCKGLKNAHEVSVKIEAESRRLLAEAHKANDVQRACSNQVVESLESRLAEATSILNDVYLCRGSQVLLGTMNAIAQFLNRQPAPSPAAEPAKMNQPCTRCVRRYKAENPDKPYPRSCPRCGVFGPCVDPDYQSEGERWKAACDAQHEAYEAKKAVAPAAEEPKPPRGACGRCGELWKTHGYSCGDPMPVPSQPAKGDWVKACGKDLANYLRECARNDDVWFADHMCQIIRRHAPQNLETAITQAEAWKDLARKRHGEDVVEMTESLQARIRSLEEQLAAATVEGLGAKEWVKIAEHISCSFPNCYPTGAVTLAAWWKSREDKGGGK